MNKQIHRIKEKSYVCIIATVIIALVMLIPFAYTVKASGPTDEILNYDITIDVNDDATLNINYHIDWEVLESDGIGPVEWVNVGIPNSHTVSSTAISDNIKNLTITSSGGYNARIDFDRKYYEGEVISFDFSVVQDYMYQVNRFADGETVYDFTAGWFDDIAVDSIVVRWKNDKAVSWEPNCDISGEYCEWRSALSPGEKYEVRMTYPNDAYMFDLSKTADRESGGNKSNDSAPLFDSARGVMYNVGVALGILMIIAIPFIPIIIIILIIKAVTGYSSSANFSGQKQKITRTKIVYHDSCPGCGAVRKEGEQFCTYCGRSFIKSEEVIEEEKVKDEDKEALKFTKNGEYHYSSSPNTYVRVHVVPVPRPIVSRTVGSGSRASSGGSHRSSCAHSSCAHSSCACACACACAGGGRAGCTNKDFYNTDLKLRQLELKSHYNVNNRY